MIELRAPAVCSGAASFSVAWSMLTGLSSDDGWAQGGFGRFHDIDGQDGYFTFSQWTGCSSNCQLHTRYLDFPTDDRNWRVIYDDSDNHLHIYKGSEQLAATSFDPFNLWTTPMEPQFFGETGHTASDVIGTLSNKARFYQVKKKKADGTWVDIDLLTLITPDSSRYHDAWDVQPGSFKIWTEPL